MTGHVVVMLWYSDIVCQQFVCHDIAIESFNIILRYKSHSSMDVFPLPDKTRLSLVSYYIFNGVKEFAKISGSILDIFAVKRTKRRSFLHDCKHFAVVLWYGFVVVVLIVVCLQTQWFPCDDLFQLANPSLCMWRAYFSTTLDDLVTCSL